MGDDGNHWTKDFIELFYSIILNINNNYTMKNLLKLFGLVLSLVVLFTACAKEEINPLNSTIEGTYIGTLASPSGAVETRTATSEITITGDNEFQLHCYADGFDTSFVMNYYNHHDSAYVCFNGNAFQEMYGHKLGGGHHGCMMCDIPTGETEWGHHMSEEHKPGDAHFGGFDMINHSFAFTFQMNRYDPIDDLHFQGKKNQ